MNILGLGLHFLLELAAVAALVTYGFQPEHTLWQKILLGIGLPIAAMVVWAVFRVPNDPGRAPVPIPGPFRLFLELFILGGAAFALFRSGHTTTAIIFGIAIAVDYLLNSARVIRLLKPGQPAV